MENINPNLEIQIVTEQTFEDDDTKDTIILYGKNFIALNEVAVTAEQASTEALQKANTAKWQMDNIIIENGNSNPEIVAARYDPVTNQGFTTLGERLNHLDISYITLENTVVSSPNATTVSIGISEFDKNVDSLRVIRRGIEIFKTSDWMLNSNGTAITLNYIANQAENFHFVVQKKVYGS